MNKAKPTLKHGLSEGHYYGLKHYKQRKFGEGADACQCFHSWVQDTFAIDCPIEEYKDWQGKNVIEAMKLLHDAPPKGQGVLI